MSRCRVQKVKVKDLFSFNRGKNLGRAFHASFAQDEDNQYTELECKIGISPADVVEFRHIVLQAEFGSYFARINIFMRSLIQKIALSN